MTAVRKPGRVQFDHRDLSDARAVGRTINRLQDELAGALDAVVRRLNSPTVDQAGLPAGVIFPYAGAATPAGFLRCDGSAVSRSAYPALFAAIGTAFGAGDGSSTFNLPDLRGRAPVGTGQGTGLTNRALAASGGEETHALTVLEIAAHTHGVTDPGHTHQGYGAGGTGASFAAVYSTTVLAPVNQGVQATQSATTGVTTQSAGSGTAHNTMPPFLAVGFIVKT